MITVTESGIEFGPFEQDHIFHVEKSPCVTSLKGIKVCEFAWRSVKENQLVFIEAKSSVPHPSKSPIEYEEYFNDMLEKFDNSLQLLLVGCVHKNTMLASELAPGVSGVNWNRTKILFYLVIPQAPIGVLEGLTSKLRRSLRRQLKIWEAEAFVINEQLVKRKGLVAEAP